MVEVLLHIWTASDDWSTNNQFLGMSMGRISELDQEIIARGNGTMERFFFRLADNNSTSLVHLKFFVNGDMKREIIIDSVGQGFQKFLPANQLPLSFLKDDRLTLQWTGLVGTPPIITAEIGFDLIFEADPVLEPDTNEPIHGYTAGQQTIDTGITYYSIGGFTNSSGVQTSNQVPAMGTGKIKKIISYFGEVPSGGTIIRRHILNGGATAITPNIAPSPGSIHEVALDRAFVKDDIIGFSYQRTGGADIRHITWIEIEYSAIELWGYSSFNGLQEAQTTFGSMFGQSNTSTLTVRANWQRSLDKGGIIKDLLYYGTAPSGTGSSIITIEVNGVNIFDSPDLNIHTGVAIDRFDNVNVVFNAGDLLTIKTIGRDGSGDGIGLCAVRIQLF